MGPESGLVCRVVLKASWISRGNAFFRLLSCVMGVRGRLSDGT